MKRFLPGGIHKGISRESIPARTFGGSERIFGKISKVSSEGMPGKILGVIHVAIFLKVSPGEFTNKTLEEFVMQFLVEFLGDTS